ncbi:hypothetical protein KIPB_015230, partial [Kipferlia bialata]
EEHQALTLQQVSEAVERSAGKHLTSQDLSTLTALVPDAIAVSVMQGVEGATYGLRWNGPYTKEALAATRLKLVHALKEYLPMEGEEVTPLPTGQLPALPAPIPSAAALRNLLGPKPVHTPSDPLGKGDALSVYSQEAGVEISSKVRSMFDQRKRSQETIAKS